MRRFAPGAWRSPAEGILVPSPGNRAQQVVPGCIVVITEGVRPVGLLTVEEVHALAPDGTPVAERVEPLDITGLTALRPPTGDADAPYRHSTAASRWSAHERAGAS
ncbi:hypothetical protein [Kribbella sancticallisti]|uniref:hypothetical protein n=1 Tax=Kribbella sancticallisti TaxID=460087 RepID=UPI0031D6B098